MRANADAIVIGSGAGGGPAAARLAESGLDVIVLEAGPRLEAGDFRDDEWSMRTALGTITPSADGRQSFYAGRCVGGSTVVNDALCWRPPGEVLDVWRREHGIVDLDDDGFGPHVEQAWRDVHAEDTAPSHRNRNARAMERGAAALGWAGEWMPRNVRGCARLGRCNLGCPTNAKQSTLVSYLPRAQRAGARVLANARVDRVRIEAGAATGVEGVRVDPSSGEPIEWLEVRAPRVLLAAGALRSGPLLLGSGLGAPTGSGFQAHSSVYVTARFPEPIHGYFGPTMSYAVSEWSDVNGRDGPGYMLENVSVRPLQTASVLPGFGRDHERALASLSQLASIVVVLRDRVRGRVAAEEDGGVRVAYAHEVRDLERLRDAIGAAARLFLAAGAEEVFLPVHGLAPVRGERDLVALADAAFDPTRLSLLYAVHLFGGAVMGGRRSASTCDPAGRVWDTRGLYVCDAAALPSNTGVNPQITIMANALRVAAHAAADRP